ncbi:MAG: glycosyltransferase family 39 protein [Planctomycetota bacterium]
MDAKRSRLVLAALAVALLVLYVANRLPALDRDYWIDEIYSLHMADRPPSEIPGTLAAWDAHPPLYFLLLHGWMHLVGQGESAVRWLSVLLGLAAAAGFAAVAQRMAGIRAATITFALACVSWHLVRPAAEARPIVLMVALAAWAWVAMLAALQSGRWRAWIAAGLLLGASAYAFYYALHAAIAMAAFVAAVKPRRRDVQGLALALGIAIVAVLPWLPSLVIQARHVMARSGVEFARIDWSTGALGKLARDHLVDLTPWRFLGKGAWLLSLPLLVTNLTGCACAPHEERPYGRALAVAFLAWCVAYAGLAAAGAFAQPRYEAWLAGLWCVLGGLVASRLQRKPFVVLAVVLLGLFVVRGTLRAPRQLARLEVERWSAAAQVLEAGTGADDIVLVVPAWSERALRFYWPDAQPPVVALPRGLDTLPGYERAPDRRRHGLQADFDEAPLRALLEGRTHIWLVETPAHHPDVTTGRAWLVDLLATEGWSPHPSQAFGSVTVQRFSRAATR